MIAATTIFLAFLLIYLVGADGFASILNRRKVMSTTSLRKGWEELSNNNSLKKGWEDLAPPFNQQRGTNDEWKHDREDVTHFCFLVHGHRGYSKVCA